MKNKTNRKKQRNAQPDERFSIVATDPKFRNLPKYERKVKVDKRFEGMFSDPRFKLRSSVDKRGRPVSKTSTEDLRRYYELSDSNDEDEDSTGKPKKTELKATKTENNAKYPKDNDGDLSEDNLPDERSSSSSDNGDNDEEEGKIVIDLARGEGNLSSSSDDDSGSDWELEDNADSSYYDQWGQVIDSTDAPKTESETSRLAVCNMDWDRIKSRDLLILFNSFKPAEGLIKKVSIYPSEFGLEKMAEEAKLGPSELRSLEAPKKTEPHSDSDGESVVSIDSEIERKNTERIRQYEIRKLRYYYAVVECDSAHTANFIYENCDGQEYESSGTRLDLRFIPEDMTFDQEPRDSASDVGDLSKYEPKHFVNTSLQQTTATLTWDTTDPDRATVAKKAFESTDWAQLDLKDYIASDSDEAEPSFSGSKENKSKYADLIQEALKSKGPGLLGAKSWGPLDEETLGLKISFQPGLGDNSSTSDDGYDDSTVIAEEDASSKAPIKRKKKKKKDYRLNETEEREENAGLSLLVADSAKEDEKKRHFNLKTLIEAEKPKKKKKLRQTIDTQDDFEMDVHDARFSAIYKDHLFNVDPSEPAFKATKGMKQLAAEKLKRVEAADKNELPVKTDEAKVDRQLDSLAASLKRKADRWKKKSK